MAILVLDYESYYSDDYSLRHLSPPEYILDSRFEVHMLAAYDFRWDRPQIIRREDIPTFLESYPIESTVALSHNALFDMAICAWRYNWIPHGMLDTLGMSRALQQHLPKHDLGTVAESLGLGTKNKSILPQVKGMHTRNIKNAGLWPLLCKYGMRDTALCAGIFLKLLPEFPIEERHIMDLVLRCAIEPVFHADVELLRSHLARLRRNKAVWLQEAGCDRKSLMSTERFKELLEELGVVIEHKISRTTNKPLPCFAKTDKFMMDLLEYSDGPDEDTNSKVQTYAAARLAHKSTLEETRAERFLNIASLPWGNGGAMMPVPLRYSGARTHRLSGEMKLNLQNLPRDKTKSKLRSALIAPEGYKVVTADLSNIEARIAAAFCDEHDLVEQFRNGEDVYAGFAERVFGHPVSKTTHPTHRFVGKVAILSLQYGSGAERFFQMVTTQARGSRMALDRFDQTLAETTVTTYRNTYWRIARMWHTLDKILATHIFNANEQQHTEIEPVSFKTNTITLPNGMTLHYEWSERDKLYGAKCFENICQSLARIVVMQAALRLWQRGYRMVLQAHDELVFLIPDADVEAAKATIMEEMTRSPSWMPDLPVAAEIGMGQSYGDCR